MPEPAWPDLPLFAGLILGGGEGRRLGRVDKPLLRLAGATLLDRIVVRLQPQLDHLALSANGEPARFAGCGLPVLADAQLGQGPLAGVLRGLRWAAALQCEALLTVPGDTPFIPHDLLRRLMPAASVAASSRIHHTVALWPVSCRDALQAHLDAPGSRSVAGFARTLPMRVVGFEAGETDPFFNINTREDWLRAEAMARA